MVQSQLATSAGPTAPAALQAEAIGGERPLRVLCSDARRNRFIECDAAKNVYGG